MTRKVSYQGEPKEVAWLRPEGARARVRRELVGSLGLGSSGRTPGCDRGIWVKEEGRGGVGELLNSKAN